MNGISAVFYLDFYCALADKYNSLMWLLIHAYKVDNTILKHLTCETDVSNTIDVKAGE